MNKDSIVAVYTVKNNGQDINKLAKNIAVGQTTGVWNELNQKERLQVSQHLAEVVLTERHQYTSTIKIAFPICNFQDDIGALLIAIYGKISLAPKIKLEDIEFTNVYLKQLKGPRFGIEKIRETVGACRGKPLLMCIFKPCLGLTPGELANMFYIQANAGINLIKDDEILYDHDFNQTLKRLEACLGAKEKAKAKTIYVINLTGKANEILDRAKKLEKNGANCILFNYVSYGLPMLQALRETISIPLMAHPAFSGALCMSTYSGLSEVLLLGKLPRILGADFVLFPSPYGSIAWEKSVCRAISNELKKDLFQMQKTWAVPSAGIKSNMVRDIVLDFGEDIVINAGTAVWEHKDGPEAGAKDFVEEVQNLSNQASTSSGKVALPSTSF